MWRFNPSRLSPFHGYLKTYPLYIVEREREEMIGNAKLNAHQQTRPQATSIKRDHKICESFHQTQLFCLFRKCNSGRSLPTTSTSISCWKDFGCSAGWAVNDSLWIASVIPTQNIQYIFSNAEKSWTATTTSHDATLIKKSSPFVY